MQAGHQWRTVCLTLLLAIAAGSFLSGCSGGSGGTSSAPARTAPTTTTRARVQSVHDTMVRGITQAGFQTPAMAEARNGFLPGIGGGITGGTGGGGMEANRPAGAMPMLGAWMRNIVTNRPQTHGVPRPNGSRQRRDGSEPDGRPDFENRNDFYFDYFLGLWVQVDETEGNSTYTFFEDEAKTKPAGSSVTVWPTDGTTFPQTYRSEYEFTAGYLAGSRGVFESVIDANFSSRMTYENTYSDGTKDKGSSTFSATGDSTWTSRTDLPNGKWMEGSGSWRARGGGGMRYETSEGYKAQYIYNADGSGRGRIEGDDPGLPVTITWDAYGNTTIEYADGTIERIPGWGGSYHGGPVTVQTDGVAPERRDGR